VIFVIAVPLHKVCVLVPAAEVKLSVAAGVKVIVPVNETGAQPPVVVTVYVPDAVGVPVIVKTPPARLLVTPAGSPVTVRPVAVPPKVYVMLVIEVPPHTVWLSVAGADVNVIIPPPPRVTDPVRDIGPHGLAAVTVYEPAAVGVPLIVKTLPATLLVSPAGNPATLIVVAVPPIVYWIFVIAVPLHTVWLSVPAAEESINVPPAPKDTVPVKVIGPQGLAAVIV
jgi:hypothetical protein